MTVQLGRQTAGTTADFSAGGATACWKFVAVASGNLAVIKAQTKVANTASSGRLGIYAHDAVNNRPANAAPLGVASVDSLATFNTTGVAQATLGAPVPVVLGTTYWLGWFSGGADPHNFQGDAAGEYYEATGDFPATTPGNWSGPSTTNAIIWGEDAGGTGATVIAVPADATGDLPIPAVSTDATVTTPAADATGEFPDDMPLSSTVETGPASGTGDFPAPAVLGTGNATVSAVPADATGDLLAPSVSSGATVTSPAADATGDLPTPAGTGGGSAGPREPDTPTTLDLDAHIASLALDAHRSSLELDAHKGTLELDAHKGTLELDAHKGTLELDAHGTSLSLDAHSTGLSLDAHTLHLDLDA